MIAAIGAVVDWLPIPRPFTLERFVRMLGEQRGRPIQLVPAHLGASAPCGLLVVTADADVICYASNTTSLHQRHIVLHEVGHLLLGHSQHWVEEATIAETTAGGEDDGRDGGEGDRLTGLEAWVPWLSAPLIRRLLGRSQYDDDAERDAEVFATMSGGRIGRVLRTRDWPRARDADVLALRTVFDVPTPRCSRGSVRG
ncbi:hypothetical protein [Actinophytocola sp.]|uniref:hypothetical protein n=1 Tax=Actinophytocola sp. TaxID=1872138 RepID=UPI00389A27A6